MRVFLMSSHIIMSPASLADVSKPPLVGAAFVAENRKVSGLSGKEKYACFSS